MRLLGTNSQRSSEQPGDSLGQGGFAHFPAPALAVSRRRSHGPDVGPQVTDVAQRRAVRMMSTGSIARLA